MMKLTDNFGETVFNRNYNSTKMSCNETMFAATTLGEITFGETSFEETFVR